MFLILLKKAIQGILSKIKVNRHRLLEEKRRSYSEQENNNLDQLRKDKFKGSRNVNSLTPYQAFEYTGLDTPIMNLTAENIKPFMNKTTEALFSEFKKGKVNSRRGSAKPKSTAETLSSLKLRENAYCGTEEGEFSKISRKQRLLNLEILREISEVHPGAKVYAKTRSELK